MGAESKKGKGKWLVWRGWTCWVQSPTFRIPLSVLGSRNSSKRHMDHFRYFVYAGCHSIFMPKVVHRLWAIQTPSGNATPVLILTAAIQSRPGSHRLKDNKTNFVKGYSL